MSDVLTPIEAVAMVPGWDPEAADIDELKGGLTNRTYHVRLDGGDFVLRLDSGRAGLLDFDRASEMPILTAAAAAGLAPQVVFADPDAGVLVTEFLHGKVWSEEDLHATDRLRSLGNLLRRVHALPARGQPLDIAAVAARYQKVLQRRPGLYAFATRCVDIIRTVPASGEPASCHNDIVAANIVEGDGLRLIDWEYACVHDPLFDLASAIGFHNLGRDAAAILLDSYAGGPDPELQERLDGQVRIYDAIQWLWLAARHLVYPGRWQARRLEELQQRIR